MAEYKVLTWRAAVTYKPGVYVGDNGLGVTETVIGTLRTLECYIRNVDDRISFVTLTPHTTRS
jgi:hypothetical protein